MLEAVTGGGAADRRRRKAKEVVVTEAYPESAYNLPASGGCCAAQAGLWDGRAARRGSGAQP